VKTEFDQPAMDYFSMQQAMTSPNRFNFVSKAKELQAQNKQERLS
jgi:hypothetical protein